MESMSHEHDIFSEYWKLRVRLINKPQESLFFAMYVSKDIYAIALTRARAQHDHIINNVPIVRTKCNQTPMQKFQSPYYHSSS